jgi:DNA-binding NarL/FixJ family response regulator
MKILIVEDQDRRFFTIIDRLRKFCRGLPNPYEIVVHEDWRRGLEYFAENEKDISLVILDVRMPRGGKDDEGGLESEKTTGVYVYNRIMKIKPRQTVLFWTVLSKKELEDEGIPVTDESYVDKDADFAMFFGKVDGLLGTDFSALLDEIFFEKAG